MIKMHGGGAIMVCSCISASGIWGRVETLEIKNAEKHHQILIHHLENV